MFNNLLAFTCSPVNLYRYRSQSVILRSKHTGHSPGGTICQRREVDKHNKHGNNERGDNNRAFQTDVSVCRRFRLGGRSTKRNWEVDSLAENEA